MKRGRLFALLASLFAGLASCGGQTPVQPSSPNLGAASPSGRPPRALHLDVPPTLTKGAQAILHATLSNPDEDCTATAQWQVSDPAVATVSAAGVLVAQLSGVTSIMASCSGLTASASTSVTSVAGRIFLAGRDTDLYPVGADRTSPAFDVEVLDGPHMGEHVKDGDVQLWRNVPLPMTIRASARFYTPETMVLSESNAGFTNGTDMVWSVPMPYAGEPDSDTYVEQFGTRTAISHPVLTHAAGSIEVHAFWIQQDIAGFEQLGLELSCGGQTIRSVTQRGPAQYSGLVFSQSVDGAQSCDVRTIGTGSTKYRLTLVYPR